MQKGESRPFNKVFYKGKVFVNLMGVWQKGFSEPMWIMTNLKAEDGLALYLQRMKIEQAFRDLKSLLNFHKLMNKRRTLIEKLVALLLIAYGIALVLGEILRVELFPKGTRKHTIYSGPFIFLKFKPDLFPPIRSLYLSEFERIIHPVRTHG